MLVQPTNVSMIVVLKSEQTIRNYTYSPPNTRQTHSINVYLLRSFSLLPQKIVPRHVLLNIFSEFIVYFSHRTLKAM